MSSRMQNAPKTSQSLLKSLGKNPTSVRWFDFVKIYQPIMEDFCKSRFPNLDSDELIQETLIALISVLPNYQYEPEARGLFHNYLLGILKNKAYTRYAKNRKIKQREEGWALEQFLALQSKEFEELRQAKVDIAIRELLADSALHDKSKEIFVEVAIKGKAPADVATAFGMTRNAVDQIRSRLTARLREIVDSLSLE